MRAMGLWIIGLGRSPDRNEFFEAADKGLVGLFGIACVITSVRDSNELSLALLRHIVGQTQIYIGVQDLPRDIIAQAEFVHLLNGPDAVELGNVMEQVVVVKGNTDDGPVTPDVDVATVCIRQPLDPPQKNRLLNHLRLHVERCRLSKLLPRRRPPSHRASRMA